MDQNNYLEDIFLSDKNNLDYKKHGKFYIKSKYFPKENSTLIKLKKFQIPFSNSYII